MWKPSRKPRIMGESKMNDLEFKIVEKLTILPQGLYDEGEFNPYTLPNPELKEDGWNSVGIAVFLSGELVAEGQIKIYRESTLTGATINRFIKEEYRNKKIGSKLLENLIFHSKRLGCYYIKSQVRKSNVACKATLKKFGFKKTGYYPNGFDGENLICYENYCKFLKKTKFN
jgi:RimJ/RimL family protein N-acetyltransferase